MKGTTHLAIGAAIGGAAATYYEMDFKTGAVCTAIAAFSALAADLDGRNIMSGKLDKASGLLRSSMIGLGVFLIGYVIYSRYIMNEVMRETVIAAVAITLLGILLKEGTIRNILLSLAGAALALWGGYGQMWWLAGLGLFIAIAPWLKHRGLTHTIWALAVWAGIGAGLEAQLGIPGLMRASAAGYLSHLVADTLTPQGVKWLYPLSRKSIRLPFR